MRNNMVRIVRLSVGGIVLGAALSVIVFEHTAGASAGAVVNARLTTLHAPVGGELALTGHALGARVAEGEPLATITNPLADATRLEDLVLERNGLAAESERIEAEIAGIDEALASLVARTAHYARERVRELEAALEQSRARHAAAMARLELARLRHARAEHLHGRGVTASASRDETHADENVAVRAVEESAAEVAAAETTLAAARAGVFLGDGTNDAPFSEQEATRLSVRRSVLEAALLGTAGRIAALKDRIDVERRRIGALRHALLTANVDGTVWEILSETGEHVHASRPVMRLLDCGSVMVTASVTESVYNALRVGDPAWFRVNGTSEVFEGTVARLAGEGAATIYANLAVAPTDEHLKRFDVKLLVPALAAHREFGCAVGRTGRVFFEGRPLDWARRIAAAAL